MKAKAGAARDTAVKAKKADDLKDLGQAQQETTGGKTNASVAGAPPASASQPASPATSGSAPVASVEERIKPAPRAEVAAVSTAAATSAHDTMTPGSSASPLAVSGGDPTSNREEGALASVHHPAPTASTAAAASAATVPLPTSTPPRGLPPPPPPSPAKSTGSSLPLSLPPVIQFGNVGVGDDENWPDAKKSADGVLVAAAQQQQPLDDRSECTAGAGSAGPSVGPSDSPTTQVNVGRPSGRGIEPSSVKFVASAANEQTSGDTSTPTHAPSTSAVVANIDAADPAPAPGLDPGSPRPEKFQQETASSSRGSGGGKQSNDEGGRAVTKSTPSPSSGGAGVKLETTPRSSSPASSASRPHPSRAQQRQQQQHTLKASSRSSLVGKSPVAVAAKGPLSSPSLAGSIPAPYVHASWKPLPVGMAPTALSGGANGNHGGGSGEWAQDRRGPEFGAGQQRGSFGPNSAPGAPGWNPTSATNPLQNGNGGVVGMLGANGGGKSVGGRLRTAPEAFGLGAGPSQAVYGGLASRPPMMVRGGSGGREGAPRMQQQQQHGRGGDSDKGAMLATSLAGGMAGGPFGGFAVGYHSPGARQPLMPPGGSPGGAAMAGIGGGVSPPLAHQLPQSQQALPPQQRQQQQQQQRQQPSHPSFAGGGVAPPGSAGFAVSSAVPATTTWQQPASRYVGVSVATGAASSAPPAAVTEPGSSGLAPEAAPFVPAGGMGVGNPVMWGAAGPRPGPVAQPQPRQQGTVAGGTPPVPNPMNPMMLNPNQQGVQGQGMSFGASPVAVTIGVGAATGPAPVPLARPPPPHTPAMFAPQQHVLQQAQQHQQQFRQQQQQQQQVRVSRSPVAMYRSGIFGSEHQQSLVVSKKAECYPTILSERMEQISHKI